MLFWEHYQFIPAHRGNNVLDPFRFGYCLNERWRLNFFERAERFVVLGAFRRVCCEIRPHDNLKTYTFQSIVNGRKFTLMGRNNEFILLHVHGRYMPAIRNYFGFLACMLQEA